jgi:hypothetical protein
MNPNKQHRSIKTSLIGILLILICSVTSAQSLIEKAFMNMPDEYYMSLSKDMRKEMLLNYLRDSISVQKNVFKGSSKIIKLDTTNSYIQIKNSDVATVEIKLLRKNDSIFYVAVNFTTCGSVCDSHIGFFGVNWQLLKSPLLPKITIADFLDLDKIKKDGKNADTVGSQFDLIFIQNSFINNENDIEVTLNTERYMDSDNWKRLKNYLKGTKLKYSWKNGIYEQTACYW